MATEGEKEYCRYWPQPSVPLCPPPGAMVESPQRWIVIGEEEVCRGNRDGRTEDAANGRESATARRVVNDMLIALEELTQGGSVQQQQQTNINTTGSKLYLKKVIPNPSQLVSKTLEKFRHEL